MASVNGIRTFLYVVLWVFAAVLLGLCAQRLHYTTHIPQGDPLNHGRDFYDPIIAELLVCASLVILWVPFMVHVLSRARHYGFLTSFAGEVLSLFVLFVMWLVGAAIASSIWGDLGWCRVYFPCRILTAILAFAWMGWIIIFALFFISLLFAISNGAFGRPMHGRYDPRESLYETRERERERERDRV